MPGKEGHSGLAPEARLSKKPRLAGPGYVQNINMNVRLEVRTANKAEEPLIKSLLDAYLRELSSYRDIAVDATMVVDYPYLHLYWSELERYPFILRSSSELAGFALIRQIAAQPATCMSVAEFYVVPDKRRQGLGRAAAQLLWKRFPGTWQLQVMKGNQPAMEFWRACIQEYASAWWVEEIQAPDGQRLYYHFEVS